MASELRVNTLKDASGNNSIATSFVAGGSAKAWANFNSTGTLAIRDSLNTSSITDNNTGDYTKNFTSSMVDADYAPQGAGQNSAAVTLGLIFNPYVLAASNFRMTFVNEIAGTRDGEQTNTTVQGDLA